MDKIIYRLDNLPALDSVFLYRQKNKNNKGVYIIMETATHFVKCRIMGYPQILDKCINDDELGSYLMYYNYIVQYMVVGLYPKPRQMSLPF